MDDLLNSRFYGYALQGFINHNRKEQLNNHLFFFGGAPFGRASEDFHQEKVVREWWKSVAHCVFSMIWAPCIRNIKPWLRMISQEILHTMWKCSPWFIWENPFIKYMEHGLTRRAVSSFFGRPLITTPGVGWPSVPSRWTATWRGRHKAGTWGTVATVAMVATVDGGVCYVGL